MQPCIRIATDQAWLRGTYDGVIVQGGIGLDTNESNYGVYIGEIVDSGEYKHLWSRLSYQRCYLAETYLKLSVVAVDDLTISYRGRDYPLDEVLEGEGFVAKGLLEVLESLNPIKAENQCDLLLSSLEGRYLIYWFEWRADGVSDWVRSLEIYYEHFSWLSYLPEKYSENSQFLEPYLAIFQTLHEEIEDAIDRMDETYRPESTLAPFIDVLAEWMPLDAPGVWNESQKRELLSHYMDYSRLRGTKEGLMRYVSLFTGTESYVVEFQDYRDLKDSPSHSRVYSRLYMDHPYGFTLLIERAAIKNSKMFQALKEVITEVIPAQTTYKLAVINPYMVLDEYVYLGINSYICNQGELRLDEQSMLAMGVIGGETEKGDEC